MRNFSIHFQNPWLLLLLIPAFALTIVLYLLLNKKFRRTRNRIVSIVLHSVVVTLCVFVLAGISFRYDVANLENEIILLVDVSETEEQSADRRDEFIRTVISEGGYDGYKMGVVTFGFDQRYAVPLTYRTERIFEDYQNAEKPDTSATNIAGALRFVSEQNLFSNPETAKIVLVTDGKETDEKATSVIGVLARKGITVDTVCISSSYEEDVVQVKGIDFPDYHINQDESFPLGVRLQCKQAVESAKISVYDNGVLAEGMSKPSTDEDPLSLAAGEQVIDFSAVFTSQGLHEITVNIEVDGKDLTFNNRFSSYYYLEQFSHVLIIEHAAGESDALKALLEDNNIYEGKVDELNLSAYEKLPTTIDDLRVYDQIILNNVSNADMRNLPTPETVSTEDGKDWFVKLLYSYVYEYGGGLLTVGGSEGEGVDLKAHAYNREDMYNTLYQELLPVQVIDYTPPVAVMIIIDISGSMGSGEDGTPLYYAKQGAISCLSALNDRDYVGIMTLDTVYGTILPLTRRTEETRIREAILGIGTGDSTVFSSAIKSAGERLRQQKDVDKRHIVIVSDGMPGENEDVYLTIAEELYRTSGVTISFVGVDMEANDSYNAMKKLTDIAGGQIHSASGRELIDEMRNDLNAPAIKEFKPEEFYPIVQEELSPVFNNVEFGNEDNRRLFRVPLGGFYGVKKRESAEVLLAGDYEVPIYAQWKYGKGMVGSFMCDLGASSSSWSTKFMADENGRRFLYNVIANLMPTENIRPGEIRLELKEENYINRLNVYTDLEEGQQIKGRIIEKTDEGEIVHELGETGSAENAIYVSSPLGEENRYSRCDFVLKSNGVYRIVIEKYNADGTLRASMEIYKAFSYSEEYDSFAGTEEETTPEQMLGELAERGNGAAVAEDDPWGVFTSFVTSLGRTYDPRLALLIIAMILFLGDVAVRKFKFKWIHELVREHRAKKAEAK